MHELVVMVLYERNVRHKYFDHFINDVDALLIKEAGRQRKEITLFQFRDNSISIQI